MVPALSLLCLLVVAQPDDAKDANKEELKKFQGTWKIEAHEEDGKKFTEAALKGRTITFGANLFLVRQKSALEQMGKVKVDAGKKTINVNIEKGEREGDVLPGIYEFDGDTLKICLGIDDNRPKDLKGGANKLLLVCKRLPAKKGESDLSGSYESEAVDIAGRRLQYDTIIERMGDSYLVLYTVKGKLVYFGIGVRKGNVFAMGWANQGRPGITLYQIEAGNRMVGEFTDVGVAGIIGTETLTPVSKK